MGEELEKFEIIGLIGTISFSLFSLACFYRCWCAWTILKDVYHLKIIFHISMNVFALFELVYSISILVYNDYTLWGYAFHVLALYFFVVSYSTVIYLWGQTIGKRHDYARRAGVFVLLMNLLASILAICYLCISEDFNDYDDNHTVITLILIVVFSVSMLLLTCGMLWYGIRLQQKLNSGSITDKAEQQRKMAIIVRINAVLIICNVCFFLRLFALGSLSYGKMTHQSTTFFGIFGWFAFSSWIPTLVPGATLLVIMRVKEAPRQPWSRADPSTPGAVKGNSLPTYVPPVPAPRRMMSSSSHDSDLQLLSELEGIDTLLVEYRNSEDSYVIDSSSPVTNPTHSIY
mmetsp:Transcript_2664/g.3994  ORF Transcript_2664/g.3994 Transcript_2664/m.3994 type:complete len:345 (-) Transcript_2664:79-1113(-)